MNSKWRKLFFTLSFTIFIFVTVIYLGFLYALPAFISSEYFSNKVQNIVLHKFGTELVYTGLKFKTYPNWSARLSFGNIHIKTLDTNKKFIEGENINLSFKPLRYIPSNIQAEYLFFDNSEFKKLKKIKVKNKKHKPFNPKNIPSIDIKKADIILHNDNEHKSALEIKKLNIIPTDDKFILDSIIKVSSNYWKRPIVIKSNGTIHINKGSILAQNLKLNTDITNATINGTLIDKYNNYNFNIKANDLSIYILEETFLTIMKHIKPHEKNFIENFYNFNGLANLDLTFEPKNITGIITIKNLSANTVKYSIPILLPNVKMNFERDKVSAATTGTFGGEKVYTDFSTVNMFDDNTRLVSGNVSSTVGSKFAKTYIPDTDIKNTIDLSVKYRIFHQTPEVEYFARIPVGSNIYYKICDLGLLEDTRRVYAKTVKIGDNMYLKTYDYSVVNGNNIQNILTGDGLFIRKNNKFQPEYFTGKTNGDAPVSLTGSFGRYVKGGTFNGNLKFDYPKEIITGNFYVRGTRYKDFYVKEASVIADENTMEIRANGDYDKAKFNGYINMRNQFKDKITIHNIDLYLEHFTITKNISSGEKLKLKIPPKTKNIDWIIEHGIIKLDKIKYERLIVESIELVGSLKNKIVDFSIPDTEFAGGTVTAKGTYNISNHSSDTCFNANNIDSNKAADMLLNLQNQIEGTANVTTHLITKNKIEHLDAYTKFSIKQGALSKLGSREFIVKKSKNNKHSFKFKIPDIINIEPRKIKSFKADLNGQFEVHDDIVNNAKIFSQNKYLSLFTEGNYNMVTQDAEMQIWGKYNKNAQKGIRILFVPLSMITKIIFKPEKTRDLYKEKINQIPSVEATPSQLEIFKVKVTGNPNDNSKIKIELKSLK